ncbi:inositol monophosphatase [Agrobacterium sp. SHOUNA12C]|nr:inositol monophosphatase [Agrobacterium sp. BETTINA12B]MCJ9755123.1 inositol monophosphatase [Agrobacterium sp. SHOUNA12C]
MAKIDIYRIAEALQEAAEAEILPRYQRLEAASIQEKMDATDLVTEADTAAEMMLKQLFENILPGALFVGEESVARDPGLLRGLVDADLAVVVDPVDGTANFVAGMPLFGVMAAITMRGKSVAGVIYDPVGKDWMIAEKGSGALYRKTGAEDRRLSTAAPVPLAEMIGLVSTDFLPVESKAAILAKLARPRMFASHRCAAHMYRAFAAGHAHFLMLDRLTPWDHLAGSLIAQEAGAYLACFDGSPYDASKREGCLLATTDPDSWVVLMRQVFEGRTAAL